MHLIMLSLGSNYFCFVGSFLFLFLSVVQFPVSISEVSMLAYEQKCILSKFLRKDIFGEMCRISLCSVLSLIEN